MRPPEPRGAVTCALHDAVDTAIRRTGVMTLSPDAESLQRDLLGSAGMIAWQEAKAAFLWGAEGCWSELPHVYGRYGSDGSRALLASLRGLYAASGAVVTDSGMSALGLVADALLGPGARVVMLRQVYNKSRTLLRWQTGRLGGALIEVDDGDSAALEEALTPETRLVFAETYTNPLTRAQDPAALAAVVRRVAPEAVIVLDDTVATAWGARSPWLDHVDLVVGSGTKSLGGGDRALAGYVVGRRSDLLNAVMDVQAMRGGVLDGAQAGSIAAGLVEAERRFRRRCASATQVASALAAHPRVEAVFHPSRPDHPDADVIARAYTLPGSLLSFRVTGVDDDGHRHLADVLAMSRVWRYALSFDGLVSKVNHHTTVSEHFTPPPVRRKLGIDRLVRLGVGLEEPEDLVAALDWALSAEVSAGDVAAWQAERRRALLG